MNQVQEAINKVIHRVLEDWAMMLVDESEAVPEIFDPGQQFFLARTRFHGVVNGSYAVLCQSGFADALAANLLGLDSELRDSDRLDALKEMANVLSGNLLTEMYGEDNAFDLILPEIAETGAGALADFFDAKQRVYCFRGDDQPVAVTFWLGGE